MRNTKQYVVEVLDETRTTLVRHATLPIFTNLIEAESAARTNGGLVTQFGNCTGIVRGSPYSGRGAGRSDPCSADRKYTVRRTLDDGTPFEQHVCGVHVRTYASYNEGHARRGVLLGEPNRAPYYDIRPYQESAE